MSTGSLLGDGRALRQQHAQVEDSPGTILSLGLGALTAVGAVRPDEGWEYDLILASLALSPALFGPGEWSVGSALGLADDLDGGIGAASVAGGLAAGVGELVMFFRSGS